MGPAQSTEVHSTQLETDVAKGVATDVATDRVPDTLSMEIEASNIVLPDSDTQSDREQNSDKGKLKEEQRGF